MNQQAAKIAEYNDSALPAVCEALGWQGGTIHQAVQAIKALRAAVTLSAETADAMQATITGLMRERDTLRANILESAERGIAAYDSLRAQSDALADAMRDLLDSYDEEGGFILSKPDPGCCECTAGVTPDSANTGPCPYHAARAALAGVK